jgi:hypothetical protein
MRASIVERKKRQSLADEDSRQEIRPRTFEDRCAAGPVKPDQNVTG